MTTPNPEDSTVPPTGSGVELPEPPPATYRHHSLGDLWSRLDLQRHAIAYADAMVAAALLKKSRERFVALNEAIRMQQEAESQRDAERLRAEAAEREVAELQKQDRRFEWLIRAWTDRRSLEIESVAALYEPVLEAFKSGERQRVIDTIDAAIAAERGKNADPT